MKSTWTVLLVLPCILYAALIPPEGEDFSCYFNEWMYGNCFFTWRSYQNFSECKVLIEFGGAKTEENLLHVVCDNITNKCNIEINFNQRIFQLYAEFSSDFSIDICPEIGGYEDKIPIINRYDVTKADISTSITAIPTATSAMLYWNNVITDSDAEYVVSANVCSSVSFFFMNRTYSYQNDKLKGSITIDLPYSNHIYRITIRQRFAQTPDEERFWSDPVSLEVKTNQSRPAAAPRTHPGAYHIDEGRITIFWEKVDPIFYGGPNFTYTVSLCNDKQLTEDELQWNVTWINEVDGLPSKSSTIKAPLHKFDICLGSENSLGKYPKFSNMTISWTDNHRCRTVEWIYTKNTYEIFWSLSPRNNITGFALFSCKKLNSKDCTSSTVDIVELPNMIFYYKLASEDDLNFAVSPIYGNQSPGMTWAKSKEKLPDILLLDIEPATITSVRILWTFLTNSSNDYVGDLILNYPSGISNGSYSLYREKSTLINGNLYSTEIPLERIDCLTINRITVNVYFKEDLISGTCCPALPSIEHSVSDSSVTLKINEGFPEPIYKLNISLYLKGLLLELIPIDQITSDTPVIFSNLKPKTSYSLELEFYVLFKGREICKHKEITSFMTKSGHPGAILINGFNHTKNFITITCEADGKVYRDTIYEMELKKIINSEHTETKRSAQCSFRIFYEPENEFKYRIRAINNETDKDEIGPWSKVESFLIPEKETPFTFVLIITCFCLLLVIILIYPFYIKFYVRYVKMKELQVEVPKALKEPPLPESQQNVSCLQNKEKFEELVESIPLVEYPRKPVQNKSLTDIREAILDMENNLKRQFSIPNDNNSEDDSSENIQEEVVNVQIHRQNNSDTSLKSIPEVTVNNNLDKLENLENKIQGNNFSSAYCRLSDLHKISSPESGKIPVEIRTPVFSGYIARQSSPEHLQHFIRRSPPY